MTALPVLDIFIRLAVAAAVGAALGLTRDAAGKPAGMRTLGLVGLGSAVVALAAHQAFAGDLDAVSRVTQGAVQGVLTGVGFIGAGVVLQRNRSVHGLTTAAVVWVAAALGVCSGLGGWAIAGLGTGIALVLIVAVQPLEKRIQALAEKRDAEPGAGAPPPV